MPTLFHFYLGEKKDEKQKKIIDKSLGCGILSSLPRGAALSTPTPIDTMKLLIAKNKVPFETLAKVDTPRGTDSFTPIPHCELVDLTRDAISRVGLSITEEEHALARGGQRYFGGFALAGQDIAGTDRQIVLGLRNAHDKSFAASVCVGNMMLVCENLCFSSDIKLARRHTLNILNDLPRVLSDAVARVVSHWQDMGRRIEAYSQTEITNQQAADLLVSLVDAKAFPARDIYSAIKEFRSPRHEEFKGGSLWTLYNSVTENLKGGDLTKLPFRTMTMQSVFDKIASHTPEITVEIDASEVEVEDDIQPLILVDV